MNIQPKHQKITSHLVNDDGSKEITTRSYYEKLAKEVFEVEKPMVSSLDTLRKDVDNVLDHVLKEGSPRLVITVEAKGDKIKLRKRYVTLDNNFSRR